MAASWISLRLFAALCLSQFRPKSGRTGDYSIALMRLDERRKKFNSHAGGSPAEVTFIQETFATRRNANDKVLDWIPLLCDGELESAEIVAGLTTSSRVAALPSWSYERMLPKSATG